MNAAHWHLLLNHIPVFGTPFGLAILAWAWVRKSEEMKKLSLAVFIVSALLGTGAYLTGEEAGMWIPDTSDATSGFTGMHQDAAMVAFTALVVLAVASLAALVVWRGSRPIPKWAALIALLASAAVSVLLAQTAHLGGQVRHTEIRSKASEQAALQRVKAMKEE